MGDPVKIVCLAEEMIRLSGRKPYEEIEIVFTGLRPGEKLYEELLISGEGVKATRHEKIRVLEAACFSDQWLRDETALLLQATHEADVERVVALLKELVPEYCNHSATGILAEGNPSTRSANFNLAARKNPDSPV
jgi:FlaA1/EpsC-like NDP-sugar epimerase